MPELTLSQAAKLTGKSKSTLNRAIKGGRLSASRNADMTFAIDPAELLRVFPSDAMRDGTSRADKPFRSPVEQGAEQLHVNALRDDLAKAEQRAAVAEALADERARALDAAERNLADLRRLLPMAPAVPPVRHWWQFWR